MRKHEDYNETQRRNIRRANYLSDQRRDPFSEGKAAAVALRGAGENPYRDAAGLWDEGFQSVPARNLTEPLCPPCPQDVGVISDYDGKLKEVDVEKVKAQEVQERKARAKAEADAQKKSEAEAKAQSEKDVKAEQVRVEQEARNATPDVETAQKNAEQDAKARNEAEAKAKVEDQKGNTQRF